MGSPFGLPSNYTSNPLYMQYMYMMMQNAMQQQQAMFEQQNAMVQAQQAQLAAQANANANANANVSQAIPAHQLPVDQVTVNNAQVQGQEKVHPKDLVDDGKISGKKKFKNFMKGVGKFFTGMVCDENGKFSLKRTLTTVAVAAGATVLCVATGGAAAPFLVAAGATIGAVQTGKGIYKAATAKTDADAELAWQSIGSGTTAVVTSIAGAKGAMKAAGKAPTAAAPAQPTVPASHQIGSSASTGVWTKVSNAAGNAVKSTKDALVATKDSFKIAGKGTLDGLRGLAHPLKSARQVQNYWNTTAKPNLQRAYSWKNAARNYSESVDTPVSNKAQQMAALEEQIRGIETKMSNSSTTAAEKARLNQLWNKLFDEYVKIDTNYSSTLMKNIAAREQYINKLETSLKTAAKENKANIKQELKVNKEILKQQKLEAAMDNVQRAKSHIDQIKSKITDKTPQSQIELLNKKIELYEKIIKTNQKILKNTNYKLAAKKYLPDAGVAAGSVYLATRDKTPDAQLTQDDLYAQSLGFANAAEMQNYLQALEAQNAQNDAAITQQGANGAYNPYNAYNSFNAFNSYMQPPMGNYLGFNELYVSPMPEYF